MTERRNAAKECIDRCIRNYNLQKYIDNGKMNYENSITELMDYVETVSFPTDAGNADHVRAGFKGPALFALMGHELPGNKKPDLVITPDKQKFILINVLKIPSPIVDALPIKDIPIFYTQRIKDFFTKQEYASRLAMEKCLFEDWVPKNS